MPLLALPLHRRTAIDCAAPSDQQPLQGSRVCTRTASDIVGEQGGPNRIHRHPTSGTKVGK